MVGLTGSDIHERSGFVRHIHGFSLTDQFDVLMVV